MAFPGVPQFYPGLNLQSGDTLNAFVHNTLSVDIALKARQGGGQPFATLVDSVVNVISRVTSANDSIQLPPTNGRLGLGPFLGGVQILLINSGANACRLYGNNFEICTIGGVSGTTGVSIGVGTSLQLVCGAVGTWVAIAGSASGGGLPTFGGTLTGGLGLTNAQGIVGTGTTQTTATLISTQIATIGSFPPSTGVRLPAAADILGSLGPIWLKNKDPSNNGLIYPPVGGTIDFQPTNGAVIIASGNALNITPGTTTGQWWS